MNLRERDRRGRKGGIEKEKRKSKSRVGENEEGRSTEQSNERRREEKERTKEEKGTQQGEGVRFPGILNVVPHGPVKTI